MRIAAALRFCALLFPIAIAIIPASAASAPSPPSAADAPPGQALAWIRFDDATQDYKGTRYRFLGDGDIQLTIDLPAAPDLAVDILWGAKNDQRQGSMIVNGQTIDLSAGGYDGFKWLRKDLPANRGLDKFDILLKSAGAVKAGFIAEVRIVATKQNGAVDLKPPASKIALKLIPTAPGLARVEGEAFPEMRKFWDRQPPPSTDRADAPENLLFRKAEQNSRQAAEALFRCNKFVHGWLAHADPKSGLIPRNLTKDKDLWNGRDSAADNWPFMVLTCFFTDKEMFEKRMKQMLEAEIKLTSRVDRLCDDYLFSKQGWAREKVNLDAIVFDNSEYVKDGLLPLTEWLGPSPWSDRAIGIVEDIWKHAPIDTPFGKIPTLNFEVNGDLLQACARLYWFTGDKRFLDWAIRLGDYYLLGENYPLTKMDHLGLMDHACEVFNGLSELYVAVSQVDPKKRDQYRKPLMAIYDKVLEIGRNEDGLLYTRIEPKTGRHSDALCDTWGYDFDGIYTAYLLEKNDNYRQAVRKALSNLKGKYIGACWADKSADGFADSIEGAINLFNREPIESAMDWADSQIRMMWAKQHPDGVIEGWHGDGNNARTSIMYALWKTQGAYAYPWRPDLRLGAARDGKSLLISLAADQPWSGKLYFDKPRHKVNMKLPLDYPRINQFPEWFTTTVDAKYIVRDAESGSEKTAIEKTVSGKEMQEGIPLDLRAGQELRLRVTAE